ncbi:TetR family transcriptional regulator [Nocardia sp. NPDC004068]|uniref:TetR family transcriptional regulator n=1 Tax=Nocardia sp. NPDC004068 TaxID=3364303 RepID=UPI0036A2AEAA
MPPGSSAPADKRRTRLRAADRRATIVAAATEVFAESGYRRATMAQIAARVGVTEPVVFQNFGTKIGLYAAVVEHASNQMSELLRAAAADTESIVDLLELLLGPGHIDQLHAPGSLGVIFADAMSLIAEPEMEHAVRHHLRSLADTLTDLLTEGRRAGDLRPDLDPAATAWWVLSFLAAHGFRRAVMPDRDRLESRMAAMTLDALRAERD